MIQEKKTDYFSIIGFVLMGALLLWFLNKDKTATPQIEKIEHDHEGVILDTSFSDINLKKIEDNSLKDTVIFEENQKIKVGFSTKGGQISYLQLKHFRTYKKEDLNLIQDNNSSLGILFNLNGKEFNTNDFIFSHNIENLSDTCSIVRMTKFFDDNSFIEFSYLLNSNTNVIDFKINSKGVSISNLNWNFNTIHTEKSLKNENVYTYLSYFNTEKNKVKDLSMAGEDVKTSSIKWFSFKQQFFSTILFSEIPLSNVSMSSKSLIDNLDTNYVKNFIVNMPISKNSYDFKLYFLENQFDVLKSYNEEFTELIPLGWGIFGWINKYFVIKVFNFLQSLNLSMGVIILLLTLLVKLIISPITYKNFVSSAKMKVLKPEIEALNEKFKNEDAMKKQQATMELYNKAGVNPLSGCIPALLQMPILIAMFRFFPSAIELRGKSFLWADDLSAYDSIFNFGFVVPFYGDHISLFTLLMALALLGYTIMTGGGMDQPKQPGMPNMKVMMYLMPVMMIFWFNDYASGLSYYYFLSNAVSILQMVIIKKYVIDEKKIYAKIEENKKKDKPKGRLQKKLEELSKQAKSNNRK